MAANTELTNNRADEFIEPQAGGQFQREVSGQFVEGMTIVPTFTAFWHAVVRHEDKSNNKLAVTVHSKLGGQWDEDWNLEHTIAGLNRREYKLTR